MTAFIYFYFGAALSSFVGNWVNDGNLSTKVSGTLHYRHLPACIIRAQIELLPRRRVVCECDSFGHCAFIMQLDGVQINSRIERVREMHSVL